MEQEQSWLIRIPARPASGVGIVVP